MRHVRRDGRVVAHGVLHRIGLVSAIPGNRKSETRIRTSPPPPPSTPTSWSIASWVGRFAGVCIGGVWRCRSCVRCSQSRPGLERSLAGVPLATASTERERVDGG